jgi:hypothetical protein
MNVSSPAHAHHLDVGAARSPAPPRREAKRFLDVVDDAFEAAQWRESDAAGGVVGQWHTVPTPREQRREVDRAGPDEIVEPEVAPGIDGREMLLEPGRRELRQHLIDRHRLPVDAGDRACGDEQIDRLQHPAAAESRRRTAAGEEHLVDIEVQDLSAHGKIMARQRQAQLLGKLVADCVGVAQPFALDDLDREPIEMVDRAALS